MRLGLFGLVIGRREDVAADAAARGLASAVPCQCVWETLVQKTNGPIGIVGRDRLGLKGEIAKKAHWRSTQIRASQIPAGRRIRPCGV